VTQLPAIALLRPAAPSDPSLARDADGRYLLPALLAGLVSSGLCSGAAAALPGDLDTDAARELKEAMVLAGVQVILGPEAPQQRLADAMERLGWPSAVVLTSYAALISGPDLTRAAKAVATDGIHAAWAEGVGPERFFFVCSRRAANALATHPGTPLPPTAFPAMLEKSDLALLPLAGISTPAERFVTGARLAGEGRPLPPELTALVLDPAEPEGWFAPKRQREILRRFSGVEDWEALERVLAPLHPNTLDRLAGQIRLFDSLLPYLPGWPNGPDGTSRRGRFVELGAGALPLCAALLCEGFAEGLALEPFAQDAESLEQTFALARTLRAAWPGLLPWPEAGEDSGGTLVCEARRLQDLALPDDGVDLIYSRMTLEHVDDPEALSAEMARVLAPGGVMLHRVDFRDHTGLVEQVTIHFDFLRHSPQEWRAKGSDTNLLRVNDFLNLWRNLGLDAEVRERLLRRVPPAQLNACWSEYADEDLYCYNALLLARRGQPATTGEEPCS
jgi:SAM-dependent methyltransferase